MPTLVWVWHYGNRGGVTSSAGTILHTWEGTMAGYPAVEQLVDKLPGIESAELVQTGGQKAVYRAVHDGQIVALKVIAIG